jgi:nucleotide-binding universal stress UspA family protein
MPVIAKILMDLDLTRRNIGVVIMSAGVVDDTAGWLILSVIAGAASRGYVQVGTLLSTLLLTGCFLVGAALVVYPVTRFLMSVTTRRFKTQDADLVAMLIVTFLCAAATEHVGIHAVFGAFVAGTVLRQIPHVKADTVHRLESFVFSVLAPVFFGIVGLKVDLWNIGGGQMLAIVLAVACLGKLIGCTVGSLWGGLRFWEALSIAVAMNARGAMELVVATIGLSLGILNQQTFSIIVMVAILTSFMAPLGLRLTMKKVRMTDEEARRILAERTKGVFDPTRVRVLFPAAGGPNTPQAALVAAALARRSADPVNLLHIAARQRLRDRIAAWLRPSELNTGLDAQLDRVRNVLHTGQAPISRRVRGPSVATAILTEAANGFDLIVLGASHAGDSLGGPVLADVVEGAPCHVIVVKAGTLAREAPQDAPHQKLLVPFDGGVFARVAVELAVRYAEATSAEITIAIAPERSSTTLAPQPAPGESSAVAEPASDDELQRISNIFRATQVRPQLLRLRDAGAGAITREAGSGRYDLIVIGAENRAIQHRLFFGHENERLIRQAPITVAIAIPNVAYLGKEDPAAIASLLRPGTATTPPEGSSTPAPSAAQGASAPVSSAE